MNTHICSLKTLVLIWIIVLAIPSTSYSGDKVKSKKVSLIEGRWINDGKMTKEYNKKYSKSAEQQLKFMEKFFDKLTLTFKDGIFTVDGPAYTTIGKDGKEVIFPKYKINMKYKVLFETDKQVALLLEGDNGLKQIQLINFESDDIHWIYSGHGVAGPNRHIRDFYRRINKED